MDDRDPLGGFLRSRRGRIGPADVGLPAGEGRRQTPGLRREELATLAGVSVDYYTRLEQGRDTNPGAGVLDALAGALHLDDDERAHLHRLARPVTPGSGPGPVRPGLCRLLATLRPAPAWLIDDVTDLRAANPEGLDLLVGIGDWPPDRRNVARYVFTHPAAPALFVPWAAVAADCVADLRAAAARDAAGLVAELAAASPDFARLWGRHDVRVNRGAPRLFAHPTRGAVALESEILGAGDGLRLVVFQDAG